MNSRKGLRPGLRSTRDIDAWLAYHDETEEPHLKDPVWGNEEVELDYERKDKEPDLTYIPWLGGLQPRKPAINEYTYWTDKMGYDTRLHSRQRQVANTASRNGIVDLNFNRFADGKALQPLPSLAHFRNTRFTEEHLPEGLRGNRMYSSSNPNLPYANSTLAKPLGTDFFRKADFKTPGSS